ncbi:MAG: inositol monophosphatase family protein, partial [Patescibacteria group bacterium]
TRVATGQLEGRLCVNPFGEDWDYAPGTLLVAEAGGVVRNIGSEGYDFRNHSFLAAPSQVEKELRGLLHI